ncbi:hypothetical protein D3C78_1188490 [compost metagenome]
MLADNSMMDGAVFQRNLDHVATSLLHTFLHSNWHFFRTPFAHANTTVSIANYGQSREGHDTTALHHFGDAVYADHLLDQTIATIFDLVLSHS